MYEHMDDVVTYLYERVRGLPEWGEQGQVLEGDHQLIPTTPCVCIFASDTTRTYAGAPYYVQADFTVYLQIYHAEVGKSVADVERKANQLAATLADYCEADRQAGGNAVDVFVNRIEPGTAQRGRSWYRSSRVTITVRTRFSTV